MVRIELHDSEASLLRDVIEAELEDLHTEIHHTDDHQYKDELKNKQATLERLRDALSRAAV